jgi:TatD DNase family protein
MLVDTHCHLDAAEFAADRDEVALSAHQAGVACIVVPAVEIANFDAVQALCDRFDFCSAAYGIHPMYVMHARQGDIDALRLWLKREQAVAIGEIGLDFFVEGLDADRQLWFFREQLKLAVEYDLPVILHVRRAVDAVITELRRYGVKGGIAHAFNGSRQQADILMGMGFKLGFGGAMTFDRALKIRELARSLPLEAIVLETDAPDIPPAWIAKQRNSPQQLPAIAQVLAELREMDVEKVIVVTTKNALAVLPEIHIHS